LKGLVPIPGKFEMPNNIKFNNLEFQNEDDDEDLMDI